MIRKNHWVYTEDGQMLIAPCLPKVVIEKLKEGVITPTYASEGDSGMDVYATDNLVILPEGIATMGLGFKLGIPKHPLHDFGYRWELQVRPRSGISAATRLTVILGSVDNFYRGELGVIIHNTNTLIAGTCGFYHPLNLKNEPIWESDAEVPVGAYLIRKGERIAQVVFNEVIRPLELVEGKVDETDRGSKGFGSSGI